MATRRSATDLASAGDESAAGLVKARVLVDCAHGKCGAVVMIDPQLLAADADPATGLHELDPSEAAVGYAEAENVKAAARAAAAADE